MFSWLKRLGAKSPDPASMVRAYEDGKQASQQLTGHIDAYVDARAKQFSKAFLPVLDERLAGLLSRSTTPELVAQQEWLSYFREIARAEQMVIQEVSVRLPEVFEAGKAMGIQAHLEEYVRQQADGTSQMAALHGALLITGRLDAHLRASGRPPITVPSQGDAGGLDGLQAAYAMARQGRAHARAVVAEYLERRLPSLQEGYLDVLRHQLSERDDSYPRDLVAQADLTVFLEQVHGVPALIRAELRERLGDWYELANLGGFEAEIDELVEDRLIKAVAALELEGDRIFRGAANRN